MSLRAPTAFKGMPGLCQSLGKGQGHRPVDAPTAAEPPMRHRPVRRLDRTTPGYPHGSFCGKTYGEVRALLAGPEANICSECVALADGRGECREGL